MKPQPESKPRTRIISVGGGKGGVGKSIVSSNLAVAMSQMGKKVVLADLDLGAANQHLLLGVDRPKPGIETLLSKDSTDAREGLSPTRIPNLALLAGSGAKLGAANITHAEKLRIIRKLRSLDADVVIVDVGAGVGYNALDFFELGAQRLVVTTPQVTAIHDAYSFLKSAVLRTLSHSTVRASEAKELEPATTSGEGDKVVDLLARLRETNPALADRVFDVLGKFGAYLIGNQVTDPAQAGIFTAVSKMVHDYLGITVPILGWLKASAKVNESVNARSPLLVAAGTGEHARALRAIAETLLVDEVAPEEELLLDIDEVVEDETLTAAPPAANLSPDALQVTPPPVPTPSVRPAPPPPPAPSQQARVDRPTPPVPPPSALPAQGWTFPVRVYRPPQRKRPPEKAKKRSGVTAQEKATAAASAESPRKRRPSLPGITPARPRSRDTASSRR